MPKRQDNKSNNDMKLRRLNLSMYLSLFFLSIGNLAIGQILQPAKWSNTIAVNQAKIGEVVELIFRAELDDTWYIYAHDQNPDLGPLPAVFDFGKNSSYKLVGDMTSVGVKEKYDDIWEGNVRVMEHTAEFRQKAKILKENLEILVSLEYQVCTTVDGKCIPGDEEFKFDQIKIIK